MADSTSIREIVEKANDRWNVAFNSGDAGAVADLYTPDASVLPDTHMRVKGTSAIREFWNSMIAAGIKEHGIEVVEAEVAGDVAYANGKWWATGLSEDGGRKRYEGTIVMIFRRQPDNSWKACLHIWN